jgi:hypothetical protein
VNSDSDKGECTISVISVLRTSAVCISLLHQRHQRHQRHQIICGLYFTFASAQSAQSGHLRFVFLFCISVTSVIRTSAVCISLLHQRNQRNQDICGLYFSFAFFCYQPYAAMRRSISLQFPLSGGRAQ